MVEQKIKEAIEEFTKYFGDFDCFKTWVENINCGEKYIVWCSYRVHSCVAGRRVTDKKRKTIYAID